jgi:hypothetical protein
MGTEQSALLNQLFILLKNIIDFFEIRPPSKNTERTRITFRRAVVTSDTTGDVDVRNAVMTMQWAFASADNFLSKHRSAGVADVNFFTGTSTAKTYPKNNIYLIVLFFPIVLIFIAIVATAMVRVCRERKMKRKRELENMPVWKNASENSFVIEIKSKNDFYAPNAHDELESDNQSADGTYH